MQRRAAAGVAGVGVRAAAGVAGVGVRAAGDELIDFGAVLGHGRGDMDELRAVTQPELSMHAVGVDHRCASVSCRAAVYRCKEYSPSAAYAPSA